MRQRYFHTEAEANPEMYFRNIRQGNRLGHEGSEESNHSPEIVMAKKKPVPPNTSLVIAAPKLLGMARGVRVECSDCGKPLVLSDGANEAAADEAGRGWAVKIVCYSCIRLYATDGMRLRVSKRNKPNIAENN